MNTKPLIPILLAMPTLVALLSATTAVAHNIEGALGKDRSAIDVYQIHCYDDGTGPNDHIAASIKDLNPVAKPIISMQLATSTAALNTTDKSDGNTISSPVIRLKGNGSGDDYYLLSVDKTSTGEEIYSVEYHCQTSDNQHTGTNTAELIKQ